MYTIPTVADFQAYFFRDFPYQPAGALDLKYIQDADIQRAINDSTININDGLFSDQASFTTCFLLLAAHNMVLNLLASSQGIAGQYNFLQASKGVGSVNEAFSIPERILKHPVMSMYAKTKYGAKYLELLLPKLIGNINAVCGTTLP